MGYLRNTIAEKKLFKWLDESSFGGKFLDSEYKPYNSMDEGSFIRYLSTNKSFTEIVDDNKGDVKNANVTSYTREASILLDELQKDEHFKSVYKKYKNTKSICSELEELTKLEGVNLEKIYSSLSEKKNDGLDGLRIKILNVFKGSESDIDQAIGNVEELYKDGEYEFRIRKNIRSFMLNKVGGPYSKSDLDKVKKYLDEFDQIGGMINYPDVEEKDKNLWSRFVKRLNEYSKIDEDKRRDAIDMFFELENNEELKSIIDEKSDMLNDINEDVNQENKDEQETKEKLEQEDELNPKVTVQTKKPAIKPGEEITGEDMRRLFGEQEYEDPSPSMTSEPSKNKPQDTATFEYGNGDENKIFNFMLRAMDRFKKQKKRSSYNI